MEKQIDLTKLPGHIAIIMDGNVRWAQKKGLDRYVGHQEGVVSVRNIVETAGKIGIKYLTLYAFSTENWGRPQEEVIALMALMVTVIRKEGADLMANNVRLKVIGDIERLPENTRAEVNSLIEETAKNTGLTLVLALSYSSRWEIAETVKKIASKVKNGTMEIADITEDAVSEHLTTKNIPDPDLLIRTGGEYRISNFLMWQVSYSELYFTDVYWPEFREENLYKAIRDYQNRERRFGKTGDQIKTQS
jgi:undecaprenyl diphosphate synthase